MEKIDIIKEEKRYKQLIKKHKIQCHKEENCYFFIFMLNMYKIIMIGAFCVVLIINILQDGSIGNILNYIFMASQIIIPLIIIKRIKENKKQEKLIESAIELKKEIMEMEKIFLKKEFLIELRKDKYKNTTIYKNVINILKKDTSYRNGIKKELSKGKKKEKIIKTKKIEIL